MTDTDRPFIHINRPRYDRVEIVSHRCSTCNCWRSFLWVHQEWYGGDVTCLWCGDRWAEEGRMERPFCPGWRKQRVESSLRVARQWGLA